MGEKSRILVVDDNSEIREVIHILLSGEGYEVEEVQDGKSALEKLAQESYDLIILDVMMPGWNGYQTCVEIRKQSNAPVLFLSARSQVEDKTMGFSSGGDDYLPKPFSYNELVGRVKALMRRYQVYKGKEDETAECKETEEESIELYGLRIDKKARRVFRGDKEIEVTDIEFAILSLLTEHPGQIFSAQHLYESVWQENYYYGASNTVMVHIRNLRNKLERDPHHPEMIKNIWGRGYCCEKE